ncbi:structural maintenance of chromosomes protein 5 [Nematocida ausubeli]|nr:structural maintenance of chromosomes protein 5 [Nematocida ausubeli]
MGNTFLHSLSLVNFQKYANTRFIFSPHGNLIAGLNGSGKSTVAGAIALTLGGTSKTMGKTLGVHELIKYGETKAVSELVIRTDRRSEVSKIVKINGKDRVIDIIITRTITLNGSTYKINSIPATLNQVKEITEALSIQINNLGQFLPQDKVTEFSTLTEEEQLETTLTACKPDLLQKKRELEEISDGLVDYKKKLQKEISQRNELHQKMERLEEEQKKLKEFLERKEHISLLQSKIKWVEYQTIKNQRDELREKLKKEEEIYKEQQRRIDALETEYAAETDRIKRIKAEIESMVDISVFTQNISEIRRSEEKERLVEEEIHVIRSRISRLTKEKVEMPVPNRNGKIEIPKIKLTGHLQEEYSRLDDEHRRSKMEDSSWQIESALKASELRNLEIELKKGDEAEERLMDTLKAMHRDTYTVVEILKKSEKKWDVTLPAILTMKITKDEYKEEVSSQLNVHALTCFVCHSKDSFHEFIQEFKDKRGLAINVTERQIHSTEGAVKMQSVPLDEKYKMVYLSECIEAPDAVKEFLNIFSKLSYIPVTKLSLSDEHEFFGKYRKITRIISNKRVVEIRRSQYTKDETLTIYPISKGIDVFSKPYNLTEKKEELKRLILEREKRTEYRKNVLQKREQIEKRLNELKRIKEADLMEQEKYERLKREEQAYKERMEEISKESADLNEKRERVEADLRRIKKEEGPFWKNLPLTALYSSIEELAQKSRIMETQYEDLNKKKTEILNGKQALKEDHSSILKAAEEIEELKRQATRKKAEADATYNIDTEDKKSKIKSLTTCIKTLTSMLAQEKAKAEISIVDYSAIEEYETCKLQLQQMERLIKREESEQEKHEVMKTRKETELRVEIDRLINNINEKATSLFHAAGIGSEVHAEYCEFPRRWKLVLKVQFRTEGQLEVLSAGRHSGGEKAVSIILYLLSMQKLSDAPFLLVDEINQGMDAGYERTIHSMLVGDKSISDKQAIVITPKLISDLSYAPTTKVHIIIETK